MAHRLNSRPAWAGGIFLGRQGLYPWHEWISIPKGKKEGIVLLDRGTDFTISCEMMRQSVIQASHRLGFKVHTNVNRETQQILVTTKPKSD